MDRAPNNPNALSPLNGISIGITCFVVVLSLLPCLAFCCLFSTLGVSFLTKTTTTVLVNCNFQYSFTHKLIVIDFTFSLLIVHLHFLFVFYLSSADEHTLLDRLQSIVFYIFLHLDISLLFVVKQYNAHALLICEKCFSTS